MWRRQTHKHKYTIYMNMYYMVYISCVVIMCVVKLIVFTYTMPQGYMHKHNITYIKYIYPTMCVCLSVGTSSCPLFVAHIKCDQNLQLSLFRWPMINCPIGKDNANCMQINITQANTTHTVGRTVGRTRREAAVNQKMNYAFFSCSAVC